MFLKLLKAVCLMRPENVEANDVVTERSSKRMRRVAMREETRKAGTFAPPPPSATLPEKRVEKKIPDLF
ncbi:hypothetical protein Bca4012_060076 [Brassica carinata]